MTSKVLIHTQYFENYNVGPEGFNTFGDKQPHWKPKGGHTFQIELDTDLLMYSDPNAIFSKMVEGQSNVAERFEYIDYEIQWQEPTVLGTEADYLKVNESLETV